MSNHIRLHISHKLSDIEWKTLMRFCEKAKRLSDTKLISEGSANIKGKMRYERDEGLWFECEIPSEEKIAEFLMAFRFFYLQKEETHFPKILNLFKKHTKDPNAIRVLRLISKQWQDMLFGKAIEIVLDETPITSSLLLDLWFNAYYFHSDDAKEKELEELKSVFSEEFAKYMLLDSVFESTKIIFKIYTAMHLMVEEHYNLN